MKKLLILSGKGGTGKTTVAAAFIAFLNACVFADCDVDAPNLHLISKPNDNILKKDFYGMTKAFIDAQKCVGCGLCEKNCRFNAIKTDGKVRAVNEYACEGCGVCEIVCPSSAITMVADVAGELMLYSGDRTLSTAKLKMGRGNSGKLVSAVKKQMPDNADIAIIDGSPGIGCPVIASVSGVDLVLVVAEPSLSGVSDMKRIVKTAGIFGINLVVCVNKYDSCEEITDEIEKYCKENNILFMGKIPYDKQASKAINSGVSLANVDCPARDVLYIVFENTIKLLKQ